MNENPEGTPNPLNPVQGAAPDQQPASAPNPTVESATPIAEQTPSATESTEIPVAQPAEQVADVEQPLPTEQPLPEELPTESAPEPIKINVKSVSVEEQEKPVSAPVSEASNESTTIQTTEVGNRSVTQFARKEIAPEPLSAETMSEQLSVEELAPESMQKAVQKKSPKTGLLVAMILLVVAIATGVAAAIILLNPFGKSNDAVPAALSKLLSGKAPTNVAMNGTINVTSNDSNSPFSYMSVNLDGGVNVSAGESFENASVMTTLANGSEFDFDVSEVGTSEGSLYLKLSNIYTELVDYYGDTTGLPLVYDNVNGEQLVEPKAETTACNPEAADCQEPGPVIDDCVTDANGVTNCVTPYTPQDPITILNQLGVFDVIDDEWIRIPTTSFDSVTSMTGINAPAQCLIGAAGKLGEFGSDFASMYQKNQFIEYSTDNIALVKRNSQPYRLTFNKDKLADFINSMNNSGFMNEMLACVGGLATNTTVTANDLDKIISALPSIYVEINEDNDFTRLYMTISSTDGLTSAIVDLSFSYPSSITINEPTVYVDINQVIESIMSQFFQEPVVQIDEAIVTEPAGQ